MRAARAALMLQGLRQRIEDAIAGARPPSTALRAAAALYGAVAAVRNLGFRRQWFAVRHLPCTVLSIGNLVVGGTGKTPMALHVAGLLQRQGLRVALVSRGYGGKAGRNAAAVVSDGRGLRLGPREAGDEPLLMAACLPGIPVVVGHDRWQAGKLAVERFGAQAIVLDDGFQHRRLARDLDLVLLDYRRPLGGGRMLPAGALREPAQGLRRAHVLILTRVPPGPAALPAELPPWAGKRPVFYARHLPIARLATAEPPAALASMPRLHADAQAPLIGSRVVAFAGIARNEDFFASAEALGYRLAQRFAFADHHPYTPEDLARIGAAAAATGARVLMTTEKDYARLGFRGGWPLPLIVLGVRLAFEPAESDFDDFLMQRVRCLQEIPRARCHSRAPEVSVPPR